MVAEPFLLHALPSRPAVDRNASVSERDAALGLLGREMLVLKHALSTVPARLVKSIAPKLSLIKLNKVWILKKSEI